MQLKHAIAPPSKAMPLLVSNLERNKLSLIESA